MENGKMQPPQDLVIIPIQKSTEMAWTEPLIIQSVDGKVKGHHLTPLDPVNTALKKSDHQVNFNHQVTVLG